MKLPDHKWIGYFHIVSERLDTNPVRVQNSVIRQPADCTEYSRWWNGEPVEPIYHRAFIPPPEYITRLPAGRVRWSAAQKRKHGVFSFQANGKGKSRYPAPAYPAYRQAGPEP